MAEGRGGPGRGRRNDGDRGGYRGGSASGGRVGGAGGSRPYRGDSDRGRPSRDGERSYDRPSRDGDRPQREGQRSTDRGDRPQRSYDRPARDSERSYDRPRRDGDRPQRDGQRSFDGGDRPQRSSDRPARDGERSYDRPRRDGDRPQRSFGRSDRPRGDGERSFDRGDRPQRDGQRSFDRSARPQRDGERSFDRPRRDGDRPQRSFDRSDRPRREGERSFDRGDRPQRSFDRSGRPRRDGGRPGGERRFGERGGRPDRAGAPRPAGRGFGRPADDRPELTEEQLRERERELRFVRAEHEDPVIPESVTENDLAFGARVELKTLTRENAEFVARHLAMAAILIESDPELAHQHAISASRKGGRIAVVRETLAITAYTIGDYALALRELRTYRRISGRDDQLALMIDAERGLGRPDRGLELGRSVDRDALPAAQRAQVAIAMSGARLDQGQPELALAELEIPQLDASRAYDFSPALFDAYAEVLEELGRDQEAGTWRRAAAAAAAALDEREHDEHETLRVVTETLDGEPFVPHPVDVPVTGDGAPEDTGVDGESGEEEGGAQADVAQGAVAGAPDGEFQDPATSEARADVSIETAPSAEGDADAGASDELEKGDPADAIEPEVAEILAATDSVVLPAEAAEEESAGRTAAGDRAAHEVESTREPESAAQAASKDDARPASESAADAPAAAPAELPLELDLGLDDPAEGR